MKKSLLFIACFSILNCFSQNRFQISIGGGYFLLQNMQMKSGNIKLKFKQDKNVFIDFNKRISQKHKLSIGGQVLMNFDNSWYEINRDIPYYTEKDIIPIFMFESLEVSLSLKRYFELYNKGKISVNLYILSGPSFNINEGNTNHRVYPLRDDDRNQNFLLSLVEEKAQKLYIPYLRVTGGVELIKKVKNKYFLGISPFFSWAGLQSESNEVTVLRDDPTYVSTGSFKRNRSGYGLRLVFSK